MCGIEVKYRATKYGNHLIIWNAMAETEEEVRIQKEANQLFKIVSSFYFDCSKNKKYNSNLFEMLFYLERALRRIVMDSNKNIRNRCLKEKTFLNNYFTKEERELFYREGYYFYN